MHSYQYTVLHLLSVHTVLTELELVLLEFVLQAPLTQTSVVHVPLIHFDVCCIDCDNENAFVTMLIAPRSARVSTASKPNVAFVLFTLNIDTIYINILYKSLQLEVLLYELQTVTIQESHNQAKFSLVELHRQKDRFVQQTRLYYYTVL